MAQTITSNPISITDTLGRRVARYVAGVSSPAVWYWSRVRGDLAEARRRGLPARDIRHLAGWRRNNVGQLVAMCVLPSSGHWYEVTA